MALDLGGEVLRSEVPVRPYSLAGREARQSAGAVHRTYRQTKTAAGRPLRPSCREITARAESRYPRDKGAPGRAGSEARLAHHLAGLVVDPVARNGVRHLLR